MRRAIVLSTEQVNRDGYRVMTEGMKLENFKANPVIIYYHQLGKMPIGRWENIRKENGRLLAEPVFDEKDPLALEVKRKYDEKFIHAASIGFLPLSYSEAPEDLQPGQKYATVTESDIFEASFCSIPVNPGATATLSMPPQSAKELSIPAIKQDATNETKSNVKEIAKSLGLAETATEQEIIAAIDANKRKTLSVKVETVISQARAKGIVNDANVEHYRKLGISDLPTLEGIVNAAVSPTPAPAATAPATAAPAAPAPAPTPAPEPQSLSIADAILKAVQGGGKPAGGEELSFEYLSKNNPKELGRIKREDPTKYKQLAMAYANK